MQLFYKCILSGEEIPLPLRLSLIRQGYEISDFYKTLTHKLKRQIFYVRSIVRNPERLCQSFEWRLIDIQKYLHDRHIIVRNNKEFPRSFTDTTIQYQASRPTLVEHEYYTDLVKKISETTLSTEIIEKLSRMNVAPEEEIMAENRAADVIAPEEVAPYYGIASNAIYVNTFIVSEPLYGRLVVRYCDAGVFSGSVARGEVGRMVHLLSIIRFAQTHETTMRIQSLALACAELHGACLDPRRFLDRDASRTAIIAAVEMLRTPAFREKIGVEEPTPDVYARHTAAWALVGRAERTIEQSLFLLAAYTEANAATLYGAVTFITTAIVSYCKRGSLTIENAQKITNSIRDDISHVVNLNRDVVSLFYKQFGRDINDNNVERLLTHWKGLINENSAMRLHLILCQATNSGLTQYLICLKAITTIPRFDWERLATILPQDWDALVTANELIGENKYYGFRRDLGNAKSTGYKSYTWVAKELLIRTGIDPNLANYAGFVLAPKNRPRVTAMIAQFIESQTDAADDEGPAPILPELDAMRLDYHSLNE